MTSEVSHARLPVRPANGQDPDVMSPSQASPPSRSPTRPQPRPEKSAQEAARIRRLNRRREYLDRNPSYFDSVEDELADPLLYDTLIRRFQSPAEREAEGRRKGYGRVLESSLIRGETRLGRMAEAYVDGGTRNPLYQSPSSQHNGASNPSPSTTTPPSAAAETIFSVESDIAAPAETKEEARERWVSFLRDRFVSGGDEEFDYGRLVDADDDLDVLERRDAEDAWFEREEPGWASSDDHDLGEQTGGNAQDPGGTHGVRTGETGVQDF